MVNSKSVIFNQFADDNEKQICSQFEKILEIVENDESNKDWTRAIFFILKEIFKENCIACKLIEDVDCGEWLYDFVVYNEKLLTINDNETIHFLNDVILVSECEWKFFRNKDNYFQSLKYDFEKLLVAKSKYRLFIFEEDSIEKVLQHIEIFKKIIYNYKKSVSNERYLFAAWIKGEKFYFDLYIHK